MKIIGLKNRIQNSLTNSSMYSFNRVLERIFKYPDLVLVAVWVLYFLLDLISMKILNLRIDAFAAGANLIFGFIFSCLLYYFFLPRIILSGKWLSGLIFLNLAVIGLTILKFYLVFPGINLLALNFKQIWLELLRIIQFQGLTISVWMFMAYFLILKVHKSQQISLDQLEIQHRSLQLRPHFVLNMLENIGVKADDCSSELAEDINRFSSILRYSYKGIERGNSLCEELEIIQAFALCQFQRFGNKLQLRIRGDFHERNEGELPFPKMLLLTLFSDIFKHGNYLNPKVPSSLVYKLSDPEVSGQTLFTFSIFNEIGNIKMLKESGFGIKTVVQILEYYFGEDFKLYYHLTSSEFSLLLMINYGS